MGRATSGDVGRGETEALSWLPDQRIGEEAAYQKGVHRVRAGVPGDGPRDVPVASRSQGPPLRGGSSQ